MNLIQTRAARVLLAVLLFYWAMRELFAPTHLLHDSGFAHRLAGGMGARAVEMDRFLPLFGLTPWWVQALWLAAAVALLLSGLSLLRGRPAAFVFFVAAATFQVLAALGVHLLDQMVPAYHQAALTAYSYAAPGLKRDVILPAVEVILLVGIGGALWQSVGRSSKEA